MIYPKLDDHPDFAMAHELLQNGYGSMVSFVLRGGRDRLNTFLKSAVDIPYCSTLGDVATMMSVPAVSSHRDLLPEERMSLGSEDNLVRVSVGIEDFDLIKEDFTVALKAAL